ncbi:MAG: glycosyltransferase family 4 protein [Saprospiraceae bacterium]|nr:glycosyltransferase family 4 protein [Saprospiraceae bacterium]
MKNHLEIYLDGKRFFYNHTGLGNYSRWLVQSYHQEFPEDQLVLLKPGKKKSEYSLWLENTDIKTLSYPSMAGLARSLVSAEWIPDKTIYHGLSAEIPLNIKQKSRNALITVHDVIFKVRPRDYRWHDRMMYDLKLKFALDRIPQVVVISQKTKQDLIEYYKVPEEKISVIYQNCDAIFYQCENPSDVNSISLFENLPSVFWICVGSFNPRKNQGSILAAYLNLPEDLRIPVLMIGGGSDKSAFREKVEQSGLGKWFIFPDKISNAQLAVLYKKSIGLIYPSLYEGFGIPAVEALACGVPVIAHEGTAVEEAAGEGGLFVNTLIADQLADAMMRIQESDSLRKALITKGLEHIKTFDVKKNMILQKNVYEKIG